MLGWIRAFPHLRKFFILFLRKCKWNEKYLIVLVVKILIYKYSHTRKLHALSSLIKTIAITFLKYFWCSRTAQQAANTPQRVWTPTSARIFRHNSCSGLLRQIYNDIYKKCLKHKKNQEQLPCSCLLKKNEYTVKSKTEILNF